MKNEKRVLGENLKRRLSKMSEKKSVLGLSFYWRRRHKMGSIGVFSGRFSLGGIRCSILVIFTLFLLVVVDDGFGWYLMV